MKLPTLYSRTSLGQTSEWTIEVVDSSYRTHEGIVGGKITTTKFTECFGKNPGKKNETSAEEQALKEAKAKHKKKVESGYHENIAEIDKELFFEPMLAHKWSDYGSEVELPAFSQPKLDGMHCLVSKDGMFTRNGKPVVSAPHIFEILKHHFDANPNLTFDGELYNHELKHDFNKIISLAKKSKPKPEDLVESAEKLEYWVYDLSLRDDKKFSERFDLLKSLVKDHNKIVVVKTDEPKDSAELDSLYEEYMNEGYEGQMVRTNSKYDNKRSKSLLKRKTFVDEEFVITDILDGKGDRAGLATKIMFTSDKGEFDTGVIGNNTYAALLLNNKAKYIGKKGTVVYQNLTPAGVPRFGKMKIIRDYE